MTTEAERLAQALESSAEAWLPTSDESLAAHKLLAQAAAELRRLGAENSVLQDCIESLTETVKDKEAEIARLSADALHAQERADFMLAATRDAQEQGGKHVAEVLAWRERFPQYVYRPQDDCVSLRLDQAIGRT